MSAGSNLRRASGRPALLLALTMLIAACGGSTGLERGSTAPATSPSGGAASSDGSAPTGATSAEEPSGPSATEPTGSADTTCGSPGVVVIPARANVFGAGIDELPAPAGGGGGARPVCVSLPPSAAGVTISASGGAAFAGAPRPVSDPDGDTSGTYAGGEIEAAGVVSSITSHARVGFLAGVFLAASPPASTPKGLRFEAYDFAAFEPELGQVFYVGDGRTAGGSVQAFRVPEGATRLFLGIADAFAFEGPPGYYDDNLGRFRAEVGLL